MKNVLILAMVAFGMTVTTAQEISNNALGLRLGSNDGVGYELSYQRKLGGDNNRLEADLGYRSRDEQGYDYSIIKLTGTYQWVWQISDSDFNWYAGAGAGVVHSSWDINGGGDDSETNLLAAGVVGVEYLFPKAPIQISLDYRPELYFGSDVNDGMGNDIALSARYRF